MDSDAPDLDAEDRNSIQSMNKNQVKSIDNHHSSDSDASIFNPENSNPTQLEQSSVGPKASGSKAKVSKQPKQKVARPKNSSKNCSFCHKFFTLKSSQIHHQKLYCSKNPNKKLGICHFCSKLSSDLNGHENNYCSKNPNKKLKTCPHCWRPFANVSQHKNYFCPKNPNKKHKTFCTASNNSTKKFSNQSHQKRLVNTDSMICQG